MIEICNLTETDKGRWVKFTNEAYHEEQTGRIKSWNDLHIFVVYHCDNDWENYADYTAEATHGSRLEFIEEQI